MVYDNDGPIYSVLSGTKGCCAICESGDATGYAPTCDGVTCPPGMTCANSTDSVPYYNGNFAYCWKYVPVQCDGDSAATDVCIGLGLSMNPGMGYITSSCPN